MATKAPEIAATWERVDSLRPWDKNPRKNDGEPVARVAKSIQRFGFSSPIVARLADRRIIAGHTRWKAAKKLGMEAAPVRFLDIDEDQAAALTLAENKLSEITPWDDDGLADVLRSIEAAGVDMDGLGWSTEEIDALLRGVQDDGSDGDGLSDMYTKKINPPVYEPTGPCPKTADLYDKARADELAAEIKAADLPEDVRAFLTIAAARHVRFNYRNIAEFYAHAGAATQRLMERSALVVIDFQDAIANGFVKMTRQLGEIADLEGDDGPE